MTWPQVALTNPWVTGYVNATTMYNNTTLPLNQLQAVWFNNGAGSLAHNVLGSPVAGITTSAVTIATATAAVVSGRKYLISSYFSGSQNTTTGNTVVSLNAAAAQIGLLQIAVSPPSTIYGTCVQLYVPGTTGSVAFAVTASTSAGTMTVAAGSYVLVVDLGTA